MRNLRKSWNLELWALESGIAIKLKESGIPQTIGIQNPSFKDRNPESGIRYPAWSPESNTVLDSFTWGDLLENTEGYY